MYRRPTKLIPILIISIAMLLNVGGVYAQEELPVCSSSLANPASSCRLVGNATGLVTVHVYRNTTVTLDGTSAESVARSDEATWSRDTNSGTGSWSAPAEGTLIATFTSSTGDTGSAVSVTDIFKMNVPDIVSTSAYQFQVETVNLDNPAQIDATLSDLRVSVGTLEAAFASTTFTYNLNVASNVESITITPIVNSDSASVTIAGNTVTSGEASAIDLNAGENTITIVVTAKNGNTQTYTLIITRAPNTPPTITGSITLNYAENDTREIATYSAEDAEGDATIWSLAGVDESLFSITADGGVLTFNSAPNFEAPGDDDTNNAYELTIVATDDAVIAASSTLAVVVMVTNIDEQGTVIISGLLRVGETLTADLTDPDGGVTDTTYQWQSSSNDTTYTSIDSATNTIYQPVTEDFGNTLRVVARYTDAEASAKTATSTISTAVVAQNAPNAPIIALNNDAGPSDTDGVTNDGQVNVSVADDFDVDRDFWEYYINGNTFTPAVSDVAGTITTFFTLSEGVYEANSIQVVQNINGLESIPAILTQRITVDTTVPRIQYASDPPLYRNRRVFIPFSVLGVVLDNNLDRNDIFATPAGGSHQLTGSGQDYILSFVPINVGHNAIRYGVHQRAATDLAGNELGFSLRGRPVSDTPASVAFTSGGGPSISSNNAAPEYVIEGNILTLSFTVNQELVATLPIVTILGQPATVTAGSGNSYSASYRVIGAQVTHGAVVSYDIGRLESTNYAARSRNPAVMTNDAITVDLLPPAITLLGNNPLEVTQNTIYQDPGATVSDEGMDINVPVVVDSTAVDTSTLGDYLVTYDASDLAGNVAEQATRTVSVVEPSSDASLSDLRVSVGTLEVAFASTTFTYNLNVASNVENITITPTVNSASASVTIAGNTVTSGEASAIDLNAGENIITIVVTAENSDTQTYTLIIIREATNAPPTITGSITLNYAENDTREITTYSAEDAEGDATIWSLAGADESLFSITAGGGVLTFNSAPNFEAPDDDDTDNAYELTIVATDNAVIVASSTLAVVVMVTNVDEAGSIGAITGTVRVGQTLTAGTVSDPDGGVTDTTYQWQSSSDRTTYINIDSATDTLYQLVAQDVGNTLRVIARYTDAEASAKTATSTISTEVVAQDAPDAPDIALNTDTGALDTDGITSNGRVDVTLHIDFALGDANFWQYSINDGVDFTKGADTSFILDEGVYEDGQVQVRQNLEGFDSALSFLAAITIDNTPPVASAGSAQTVNEGDTVRLDGRGSTDNEGIATYAWTSDSATLTLSGADTDTARFTAPDVNARLEISLTLTVTDIAGLTDSATVLITINNVIQVSPNDFVTVWDITDANSELTFPGYGEYTINWGDGSASDAVSNPGGSSHPSHTYAGAGTRTVIVSKTDAQSGLTRFHLNFSSDSDLLLDVAQWGTSAWTTMESAFRGASNLAGFSATDDPNLSLVASMDFMFANASTFNQDIGSWNVENVTNMAYLFSNANIFDQDISSWSVSRVSDTSSMFASAVAFNQNISNWDVSQVTNMDRMFVSASTFNQNIANWNVESVTRMDAMFSGAFAFNQNIANWNVSAVTHMDSMFASAVSFNQDISSWNVESVINMNFIFSNASAFEQNLGPWYVLLSPDTASYDVSSSRDIATIVAQNTVLDSQVSAYELTGADADKFTFTSSTGRLSFTGDTAGTYNIDIEATDGTFGTSPPTISRQLTITGNFPVAHAGSAQTVNEGDTVRLNGTGSTDDDAIATYAWTSDIPTLTLTGADTATVTFTAPNVNAELDIILTLIVTDTADLTDSATVLVTVVPQATTITVDIDGNGSFDRMDGTIILRYSFSIRGDGLTRGQTETPPETVEVNIQNAINNLDLDIDESGFLSPEDFIMILRYMISSRGDALTSGQTATLPETVEDNIEALIF